MGAVLDAEFGEDLAHVIFNRAFGDAEVGGDFLVGAAGGELFEDFEFARGKRLDERLGGAALLFVLEAGELGDDFAGDGGLERGFSAGGAADGFGEFFGGDVFQEITDGTGGEGGEDLVVVVEGGEHEYLRSGCGLADEAGGFDAVHAGHAQVHEDDVGTEFLREGDGFASVGGLADEHEIGDE